MADYMDYDLDAANIAAAQVPGLVHTWLAIAPAIALRPCAAADTLARRWQGWKWQ
jgi:hypothetical protein